MALTIEAFLTVLEVLEVLEVRSSQLRVLEVLEVRSSQLRSSGVSFWLELSSLLADSRLLPVSYRAFSQYVCMERSCSLPLLMWPPTPLD